MSLNVGEYGKTFNLNVNFDISGFSALTLTFTRPDDDATTFTATGADVTVGAVPLVTDDGTFAADEYCIYVFQDGDLTVEGEYLVRLTYQDGPDIRLISDSTSFTVSP